jgi:hypothetical protein
MNRRQRSDLLIDSTVQILVLIMLMLLCFTIGGIL